MARLSSHVRRAGSQHHHALAMGTPTPYTAAEVGRIVRLQRHLPSLRHPPGMQPSGVELPQRHLRVQAVERRLVSRFGVQ